MLSLSTGSSCDVCAEEYGPQLVPHSIPCGHVLCETCCTNIIEKTSPRFSPACPFCREPFTNDAVRLIRIDFSASAYTTTRRRGPLIEEDHSPDVDLAARKEERILLMEAGCSRSRAEARRLEDKVAKVAAKKCSVEEVSTLHNELQDWLKTEVTDQSSSLYLSAALLRAILMNHIAHSEASKAAKLNEATLKGKVDDMEIMNQKLEVELRRQRSQYAQKAQECQTLSHELNRLKLKTGTTGIMGPKSLSPSTSPPPPSLPPLHAPTARSAFTRLTSASQHASPPHSTQSGGGHMRSASVQPQSGYRPSTSSLAMRSATPAASHSHSFLRSDTLTPKPILPSRPRRLPSPTPPVPPIPSGMMSRTFSASSSTSEDDGYPVHERWIPTTEPPPMRAPSRLASAGHTPSFRYS